MRKFLYFLFVTIGYNSTAQDYVKMAAEIQQNYKDAPAAIIKADIQYDFSIKSSKKMVEVTENKTESILSLRYNSSITETEVYDNTLTIEKFYAESNMRQRLTNEMKYCGRYTNEGYFYDDSKFCQQTLKLKEIGELWTLKVLKKISDSKYFTSVYFEDSYPVKEKKISFNIPSNVEVEIKEFNFLGYSITKSEKANGGIKTIEYIATNLNQLKEEESARGIQYNHPHILVLVKSYTNGGEKINVLSSVNDLYNWYASLTRQLSTNREALKPTVDKLIKDKKTDEEKISSIYYWVQDNIRYIAFEDGIAGFKPDEAHNVFEKKYGDCKGMANLTKEMLKLAGYDARLTWIGTKRIMYDYTIPSLAVDNHMICTVILGGKQYFLDATEKYNPFGENAERIQNRPVLIEDGEKYILSKVPVADKSKDLEVKKFNLKINGTKMEGTSDLTLYGEGKKNFLYGYFYTKSEDRQKLVENNISGGNKNISVASFKLSNLEERTGSVNINSNININNNVSTFNNEMYIDIDPVKDFKGLVIKDTRQGDVDFGMKIFSREEVELQIPEGFTLSSMPENLLITDPEFSFSMKYSQSGDKIKYIKEISIPEGVIKKASFTKWNDSLKKLTKHYNNQLILKK